MKFTKILLTALSMLLITSCANLDKLKKKPIHGNNFNDELSRNYLKFADSEAKQFDWRDSNHFAKKGLQAAKGQNVMPEELAKWNLTKEHRAELTHARAELISSLTDSNKAIFPKEAANAQAFFDCWVEEQEENWQEGRIVYCKKHYQDAIAQLHHVIKRSEVPKEVVVNVQKEKQEEKIEHNYIVYFNFDKSHINKSEHQALINAIEAHRKLGKKIHLDGYADDTGLDEYNDKLSLRRAESVKQYLINMGLSEDSFKVHYHGKHHLAVKTAHGVKERLNRRVEIKLD